MSSATKKFALAALSVPVLAALAIGLAGSAVAAPTEPQPSDTGTTTTAYPDRISVPIKRNAFTDATTPLSGVMKPPGVNAFTWATNLVTINLPRVDPIGDGVWGQTNSPKLGTAARPASRTARGASGAAGKAHKAYSCSWDGCVVINESPSELPPLTFKARTPPRLIDGIYQYDKGIIRAPKKDINENHDTRSELVGTPQQGDSSVEKATNIYASQTVRSPKRTTRGAAARAPREQKCVGDCVVVPIDGGIGIATGYYIGDITWLIKPPRR